MLRCALKICLVRTEIPNPSTCLNEIASAAKKGRKFRRNMDDSQEAIAQLDDKWSLEDMVAERYEIISSERETRQSTTSGVYLQASSSSSDQNGNPLESNSIFPTIDYLTTQASNSESIPVGNSSQTPDQNFEISSTQNLVLNSENFVFAQNLDEIDKPILCKTNDTKNGTCNSQDVEISPVSSHSSDFISSSPESLNASFSPRLNFITSLTSKNNNLEETPCKGDINIPKSLCEDTLMASPSSWCSDVGDISSDFVNHQNKGELDDLINSQGNADKKVHELEKAKRVLESELMDMIEQNEELDKKVHELEKAKRLESELMYMIDIRDQNEELEDELQATEDQKMRLEVNMQALKTQYERDLQAKEESGEEKRRGMSKQIRDLKAELEEERRQKVSAFNIMKLEADFKDLESTMEMINKIKEDSLKRLKILQILSTFLSQSLGWSLMSDPMASNQKNEVGSQPPKVKKGPSAQEIQELQAAVLKREEQVLI